MPTTRDAIESHFTCSQAVNPVLRNAVHYRDESADLSINAGDQVALVGGVLLPVKALADFIDLLKMEVTGPGWSDLASSLSLQCGGRLTQQMTMRTTVSMGRSPDVAARLASKGQAQGLFDDT
jgi:hypothetical protein